jgi:hypothetical protein
MNPPTPPPPRLRAMALAGVLAVAAVTAACGGSTPSSSSDPPTPANEVVVTAPDFQLQGCTYVLENTIPAGEPQGVQPNFKSFEPDESATSAMKQVKEHGGVALANGFNIPGGTKLYAGPDASKPSVGIIPSNYDILVAEPVIWTDGSGNTWVAFFVSCGGPNLYWVQLKQIQKANPNAASSITPLLSVKDSLLPITIADKNFAWKNPQMTLIIGRGEMWGPLA